MRPTKNELKRQFAPPWRNRIFYLEDGRVRKKFGGNGAKERFEHEVSVLSHLAENGCRFVPKLNGVDRENICITLEHCGLKLPGRSVTWPQIIETFKRLEPYGVRHDDPSWANMLFRESDKEIVLIDFEFSTFI